MKKNQEKIKPGWWLPVEVKDLFVDFCDRVGHHIQDDFAGALWVWPYLPAQIREWAILGAKNEPLVDAEFWKGFQEGIRSQIPHLLENQTKKKKSSAS